MGNQFNGILPYQVDNPNDGERHEMLKYILSNQKRLEDFENIISLLSPPPEITTICPKRAGKNIND
jgi:monoamine oxidase